MRIIRTSATQSSITGSGRVHLDPQSRQGDPLRCPRKLATATTRHARCLTEFWIESRSAEDERKTGSTEGHLANPDPCRSIWAQSAPQRWRRIRPTDSRERKRRDTAMSIFAGASHSGWARSVKLPSALGPSTISSTRVMNSPQTGLMRVSSMSIRSVVAFIWAGS